VLLKLSENEGIYGLQENSGERKKCVLRAPAVPYVIRRRYRKDQSSRGASLYGIKQIFRFEIDFIFL